MSDTYGRNGAVGSDEAIDDDGLGRHAAVAPVDATTATPVAATRANVVGREAAEFGGFKWGSAFFGWLTAAGMAVLLTAILSAIGAGVSLGTSNGNANNAAKTVTSNATTVTVVGAIALAVILFVSYYCGGYVAGRMARFSGLRQGFAVWLWAIVMAIIGAIIAAIAGSNYDILGKINGFPRIPVNEGNLTVTGIITAIVVALLSLIGALLGGLAGMHYHRKVDRVGFDV
ncbi:hypothetical protein ACFOYW_09660 [Gryllotalpicola reticulitermitis]|uniref:Major facilitator superfamily (MFS) profile domain-containing protein n=1 Tax=Gryllotalpicola reticulitermitis TaxID=1184153 RepID=A0ABV8Q8H5_9MICO